MSQSMQAASEPKTRPSAQAAPPAPTRPDIRIGPDGRLVGIEPILEQISSAVIGAATPVIRDDLLPIILRDKALQREVGYAAGEGIANTLSGPAWIVAIAVAAATGFYVYKNLKK